MVTVLTNIIGFVGIVGRRWIGSGRRRGVVVGLTGIVTCIVLLVGSNIG